MRAERGCRHSVVGAVHVLSIRSDDPMVTRAAVEREWSSCSPRRVVVDLSTVPGPPGPHVDAIRETARGRSLVIRLRSDTDTMSVGESYQTPA